MTEPIEIEVNLSVKNLNEIKAKVTEVMDENVRLRAELARIKPSWDDAPDWATALFMGEVFWMNDVQQKAVCPSRREERP